MVTPFLSSWAISNTCSWPESFTVMSWRRNFMPYLLCVRAADKCFEALWIEGVACHQSTKGSSAAAPPPRFLVVSLCMAGPLADQLAQDDPQDETMQSVIKDL